MFSFFKNLFNIEKLIDSKIEAKIQLAEHLMIDNSKKQISQYNFGMSYSEVRQIITEENARANQRLVEKIEPRLLPEDKEKIKKDYDFLHTYNEAVKISSKRQDKNVDEILSELLIDRIKSNEDITKIVYNEAIKTMGILTNSQLDIISLCYIMKSLEFIADNVEEFINRLNRTIQPFINFEINNMDFYHIEYTKCGSIIPLQSNVKLTEIFNPEKYPFLKDLDILTILENFQTGQSLKQKWKNPVPSLRLTSVGQLIAAKYIKIKIGEDVIPPFNTVEAKQ